MRYLIGDVARTLGLTPAALHFYEREGVIAPMKGNATRRSYGAEDVIRLISYKKYRSMEMQLKTIAQQFSRHGNTSEGIAQRLRIQRESALATARRYERLAQDIAWFETAIAGATEQVDIALSPACYMLCLGKDGFVSHDRSEQARIALWLDHMPAARVSVLWQEQARFGYTVDAARAEELGLSKTEGAVYLPARAALHTYVTLPHAYYEAPDMAFAKLQEAAKARGFHKSGVALGVDLCVECHGDARNTLVECWLPIE